MAYRSFIVFECRAREALLFQLSELFGVKVAVEVGELSEGMSKVKETWGSDNRRWRE
ncbi:hypothetical protein U1Q18_037948, partial [Sarracenia purpurea var. burkii]